MAFNPRFFAGTSADSIKKILNYKEFMISNEEAERLAANSHRLISESEERKDYTAETVAVVATIKNEVVNSE
jgi:hypothetical protein